MIGIFSENNNPIIRGPQKVFLNLIKGFDLLKVEYEINKICDLNGCLNSYRQYFDILPNNTLMGPNLVVNPIDDLNLFTKFNKFLVPSNLVKNNYFKFDLNSNVNIHTHATGIDTEFWNEQEKNITKDCLIYFKNRTDLELELLKKTLNKINISYYIIKYGYYNEEDLKQKLSEVKFCLLLTGTESQGIGYMEILSTNTPCFVFNFIYDDGKLYGESIPYFNKNCGFVYNGKIENSEDELIAFLNSLATFSPREFIVNDFTLEKSANKYIELLKK